MLVWLARPWFPAWLLMWALAFAIFFACKLATWFAAPNRRRAGAGLTLGYFLLWSGLDAPAFLAGFNRPDVARPSPCEWRFAAFKTFLGVWIYFVIARLLPPPAAAWGGMIGIVLGMHFGAFHLLSCAWRRAGVAARPLMDWPIRARSAGEFWGRRWNTAFRDLTHRLLFRPLAARLGPRAALAAGFFVSGFVHDLVISFPARGGYGLPTLFFALQGALLLAERTAAGRRLGLGRDVRGWLATHLLLLVTLPLLFHAPFRERVIIPFMHATGAL